MRLVLHAMGPLLLAPRTARVAVMLVAPAMLALWGAGEVQRLDDLREMMTVPEGISIARRFGLSFAMMIALVSGVLAGHAAFDARRMHASWALPAVRTGLWHGQLLVAAISAVASVGWVMQWAPLADAVQAGLVGTVLFGVVASWAQMPALLGAGHVAAFLPLVVVGVMLYAPDTILVVADLVGVPGLAVLATGALWLVRWGTTPEGHRRILAWENPGAAAPSRASVPDRLAPPRTALEWLRRLGEAVPVPDVVRRVAPIPDMIGVALRTAFIAAAMLATGTSTSMILFVSLHGTFTGPRLLPYPISRRDRARLEFVEDALHVVVVGVVAAGMVIGLRELGLTMLPWFAELRTDGIPESVALTAALAWFPLAHAGRAFAPMTRMEDVKLAPRLLMAFFPFLLASVLSLETANRFWRASQGHAPTAIGWCALLGLTLQGAHYLYLQAVFRRRDLVLRGTS